MKTFNKIDKVMTRASKIIALVTAVALAFIMMLIVVDCIMRWILTKSIPGAYELVQVAMALVVFFSFAYAQRSGALVHVTFFMRKFPGKVPMLLWTLTGACSTFICILLTWASYQQTFVIRKIHTATTVLLIPIYPFYALMVVGFAAFSIVLIYDTIKNVVALFNNEVAEDVIAHWPS